MSGYGSIQKLYAAIKLRGNPPDVRVTNRQKPGTKIMYIVLQPSVGLF